MTTKPLKYIDIVMEGGGVKGAGLIGAVEVLHEQGYRFRRIAGTSVGALVGAMLAAGLSPTKARQILLRTNFDQFRDPTLLSQCGPLGQGASLLLSRGLYRGDALYKWTASQLEMIGVRTFADLRLAEPWAKNLPPAQRYKLVVIVADVGRGRLLRLPWDYHLLGRNPDTQLVASAVRASASIPFFYKPVRVGGTLLVDGGLLSNFPVEIFDGYPGPVAWPTFGIKLSARAAANSVSNKFGRPLGFPLAVLDTLVNAYDQIHLDNPATTSRTIFVDSAKIKATDFDISLAQRQLLRKNGRQAAKDFLANWNYASYITQYVLPQLNSASAALYQEELAALGIHSGV